MVRHDVLQLDLRPLRRLMSVVIISSKTLAGCSWAAVGRVRSDSSQQHLYERVCAQCLQHRALQVTAIGNGNVITYAAANLPVSNGVGDVAQRDTWVSAREGSWKADGALQALSGSIMCSSRRRGDPSVRCSQCAGRDEGPGDAEDFVSPFISSATSIDFIYLAGHHQPQESPGRKVAVLGRC